MGETHVSIGQVQWQVWLEDTERLAADVLRRRGIEWLDVDALWEEAKADREARDDRVLGQGDWIA